MLLFAVPLAAVPLTLAACSETPPDPRGVDRDEVLLQVSATGRADSRPDEARFTAGVETIAASAAEAGSRNAQTIQKVMAALAGFGVKEDDVQTRSLTLQRIDYGPNRGRFQANNLVEIKVRDIKRAGEAIAAATQAGANVLAGPNLRVSDPENASRSAYAAAYKAARARAEAYAQAAGLKVARVLAIRDEGSAGGPPMRFGYDMDASGEAAAQVSAPPAPPVSPGISTREVRVRADFALAE
jgi:hypothetical protein